MERLFEIVNLEPIHLVIHENTGDGDILKLLYMARSPATRAARNPVRSSPPMGPTYPGRYLSTYVLSTPHTLAAHLHA